MSQKAEECEEVTQVFRENIQTNKIYLSSAQSKETKQSRHTILPKIQTGALTFFSNATLISDQIAKQRFIIFHDTVNFA